MDRLSWPLRPRPPFRLDLTVWVLRRRAHNLVDRWDGKSYRRVLLLENSPVEVAVSQTGPPDNPQLQVQARAAHLPANARELLTAALTRMLGLEEDLAPFYRLAAPDPRLDFLARQFRGVKPPRFPSVFEALVNGIACQQISLTAGIHVLNRLAAAHGPALPDKEGTEPAFPRPADLADLSPDDLRALGFSRQKGRYLIDLAQAVVRDNLDLEGLSALSDEEALDFLLRLRGVGRWTAEYALLRGLGRWHFFPGDDVGARNRLQKFLGLPGPLDYEGVKQVLARWHPYGGLVYFHFLLSGLAEEGQISP